MALPDAELKRILSRRAHRGALARRQIRRTVDLGASEQRVEFLLGAPEPVVWNPSRPPVIAPKAWRNMRDFAVAPPEGKREGGDQPALSLIQRMATAQANGTLSQRRSPGFVGQSSEFLPDTVVAVDQSGKPWTWTEVKRFMRDEIGDERGRLANPFGTPGVDDVVQWDSGITPEEWFEPGGGGPETQPASWQDITLAHLGAVAPSDPLAEQFIAGSRRGGGGGGGRGGGATYVAPDRDAVREQVKNYVVAVLGTMNTAAIDAGVEAFMAGDREAFQKRESQQVDPWQKVLGVIRDRAEYKDLHELRPESVDEMQWVTSSQGKLKSLGINAERAEQLGIGLARVGADDEALLQAAEQSQFGDSRRLLRTQREGLKATASAAARLI